jgi:xanthosine utilization system XapX-like protein
MLGAGGGAMATLTILSVFAGAAVGLRFSVFALVPVIILTVAIVAVSGGLRGESIWWVAVAMVLVATCTQVGYIGVCAMPLVIGDARESGGTAEISKAQWIAPAVAIVAVATSVLSTIRVVFQLQCLIFGYLIPISIVAARYGSMPAILTSVASDLCALFFFYPPELTPFHDAELSFFSLIAVATGVLIPKLRHFY